MNNQPLYSPLWNRLLMGALTLVALYFIGFPLIDQGSFNHRIVEAFNSDESDFLWPIQEAFSNKRFSIHHSPYGYVYYNAALLLTYIVSWFSEINDQVVMYITRGLSFTSLILTALVGSNISRRLKLGPPFAAFALVLFSSHTLLKYSVMLHPDITQVLFIVLSLGALIRLYLHGRNRFLYWASFWAGAAFATKYGGLALIPMIAGTYVILEVLRWKENPGIWRFISNSLIASLAFVAAILFLSPQSFVRGEIWASLAALFGAHGSGHWFSDESGIMGWLSLLFDADTFPWVLTIMSLLSVYLFVKTKEKRGGLILYVWLILYLLLMSIGVGSKFAHYLIPILPVLAVLSLSFVIELLQLTGIDKSKVGSVVTVAALICFSVFLGVQYSNESKNEYANSARLKGGKWIESNISEPAVFVSEKYVYVPPLDNIQYSSHWGLSSEILEDKNPDFIAIHEWIYNRFSDPAMVSEYRHGEDVFMDRYELYKDLMNGSHPGYELAVDFGEIVIYKRRTAQ